MTWLIRVFLLVIAFFLIQKVLAFIFGGWLSNGQKREAKKPSFRGKALEGQMVKDPQCGMYVASSLALSLRSGEEVHYFCSEECRDAYLKAKQLQESVRS
jgi:YHS domain-containing protein